MEGVNRFLQPTNQADNSSQSCNMHHVREEHCKVILKGQLLNSDSQVANSGTLNYPADYSVAPYNLNTFDQRD